MRCAGSDLVEMASRPLRRQRPLLRQLRRRQRSQSPRSRTEKVQDGISVAAIRADDADLRWGGLVAVFVAVQPQNLSLNVADDTRVDRSAERNQQRRRPLSHDDAHEAFVLRSELVDVASNDDDRRQRRDRLEELERLDCSEARSREGVKVTPQHNAIVGHR